MNGFANNWNFKESCQLSLCFSTIYQRRCTCKRVKPYITVASCMCVCVLSCSILHHHHLAAKNPFHHATLRVMEFQEQIFTSSHVPKKNSEIGRRACINHIKLIKLPLSDTPFGRHSFSPCVLCFGAVVFAQATATYSIFPVQRFCWVGSEQEKKNCHSYAGLSSRNEITSHCLRNFITRSKPVPAVSDMAVK